MHKHKFIIGSFGAFCMEPECMYTFSAHDISKILEDIANNVSAQQSADRTCATCGSNHFKDEHKVITQFICVSCGVSR